MNYPIVKIDRITLHELLPLVMQEGLFNDYKSLKSQEEILESHKNQLGVENLKDEEIRKVLTKEKIYKKGNYIIRNYGSYVIGFNIKDYFDSINKNLDSVSEEEIESILKKLRLNQLAYKLMIIILSEAYLQSKFEDLVISKAEIFDYLGKSSNSKYLYEDISNTITSLRWLNYQKYNYKTKNPLADEKSAIGTFLTNYIETKKEFHFWINPNFLGSVLHLITKMKNSPYKKYLKRGYISFPTIAIRYMKYISSYENMLFNFLICDSGNPKLNSKMYKVVAYKPMKLIEELGIKNSRPDMAIRKLIETLKNSILVSKTEPTIEELEKTKPDSLKNKVIRIYTLISAVSLGKKIESLLKILSKNKKVIPRLLKVISILQKVIPEEQLKKLSHLNIRA